jgi:uncharacterized protein YndB with AHSA1/START domain
MTTTTGQLQVTTPSDREILLTCSFAAPRRPVFAAWTRPEQVKRWWGLRHQTMNVCEIDLRPGGGWRFVLREPDGQEFSFRGGFPEIAAPQRLVHAFVFEPMPMHEALVTVTLAESAGQTLMTETFLQKTREARDGHLQ